MTEPETKDDLDEEVIFLKELERELETLEVIHRIAENREILDWPCLGGG